jgi:hypothetical protein
VNNRNVFSSNRPQSASVPPTGAERLEAVEKSYTEFDARTTALQDNVVSLMTTVSTLMSVIDQLLTVVPLNSPSDRAGRVKKIRQELYNNTD